MAARGAVEKETIQNKILEMFDNAFLYGKEIRVPIGDVQIKIALTCAKDNVEAGDDNAVPGTIKATKVTIKAGEEPTFEDVSKEMEPSADELNAVSDLMSALGL